MLWGHRRLISGGESLSYLPRHHRRQHWARSMKQAAQRWNFCFIIISVFLISVLVLQEKRLEWWRRWLLVNFCGKNTSTITAVAIATIDADNTTMFITTVVLMLPLQLSSLLHRSCSCQSNCVVSCQTSTGSRRAGCVCVCVRGYVRWSTSQCHP